MPGFLVAMPGLLEALIVFPLCLRLKDLCTEACLLCALKEALRIVPRSHRITANSFYRLPSNIIKPIRFHLFGSGACQSSVAKATSKARRSSVVPISPERRVLGGALLTLHLCELLVVQGPWPCLLGAYQTSLKKRSHYSCGS